MPETFGSGTAGSGFDPRCQPRQFLQTVVSGGGSTSFRFTPDSSYPVILAIDVVTGGSSSSATCLFATSDTGHPFWSINVGSSTDTFSWRGWLVLPAGEILFITNNSSNFASVIISGLQFPVTQLT